MENTFRNIFAKEFEMDPSEINDEMSPENTVKWDSLAAINLVIALESTFSIKMSTKEIMKARTVGLVRAILKTKGIEGLN